MPTFESTVRLQDDHAEHIETVMAYGRAVVSSEAVALKALNDALDENFVAAVDALMGSRGRVIVCGIGKSGHVGRKVAATFASTGTPAFFVHAAEAAHGDLGMMARGDTLLLLSFSGETLELKQVAAYAADMGIAVVAIGSRPQSTLMRRADIRITLPLLPEACPENISPTTSSIMMLAVGDALAIAIMNLRGMSRAKLNKLHPGGNIGRRLIRVSALMHAADQLPLMAVDAPMREVILKISEHNLGVAGIVDAGGLLVGVITDGDLRRHIDILLEADARAIMTDHPATIDAMSFAEDALERMETNKITSLFVTDAVDPRRPVGLLHIHDILRQGLY